MTKVNELTSAGPVTSPALAAVNTALANVLSDGVDVHRCLAAKALGRIGDGAAVEPLIKALLDEDEDVRTDAAEALLALGDPQSVTQLTENLLGDPCSEVKLAAIQTLAKVQDKQIIPWLRRMVKGRDEEIQWDETEFFSTGWDDWVEIQLQSILALAELGATEAVPDIVDAMKDENAQDITETVFKALIKMGPDGTKALIGFLDEPFARPRRRAATVLAAAISDSADDALTRIFSDESADVRMAGLRARAGAYPQDTWITVMLKDADAAIRAEAIALVSGIYAEDLLALLDDPSETVQAAALGALVRSKGLNLNDDLIATLSKKIRHPEPTISMAAARTFAIVAPEAALTELADALADSDLATDIRLAALQGLAKIGGDTVTNSLVAVVDDESRQVRLETMAALASVARHDDQWPNPAAQALLAALGGIYDPEPEIVDENATPEPEPEVQEPEPEAVAEEPAEPEEEPVQTSTLASMLAEGPEIAPVVGLPGDGVELTSEDMERLAIARRVVGKRKMAKEPEVVVYEDIRRFAARVLVDVDHDDVTLALAGALGSDDPEVVQAAAQSIAEIARNKQQLPDGVSDAILAQLDGATLSLKLSFLRALAVCPGDDVVTSLAPLLTDEDSFVRDGAIVALRKLGMDGFAFESFLSDPDPSVRLSAATAIAATGGDKAVARLVEFAISFEGYHGRNTARLLRDVDAKGANAEFLKILHDNEQRRVWSVAIEGLEELNNQENSALAS